MSLTVKEIKARYFEKKYNSAPVVECARGCGGTLKSVDMYGRKKEYINGHNARKYNGEESTRWAVNKRWAKNHPDKIRDGKRNFYRRRKLKAMAYLGNACHFCGLKYDGANAPMFEFHHVDPSTKDAGITRMVSNAKWATVEAELAKCVLTCGNCHNQYHGGEW